MILKGLPLDIKKIFLAAFFFFILSNILIFPQSKSWSTTNKDTSQSELMLQKLKNSGMTESQIRQNAAAIGYTVDDYLKMQQLQLQQNQSLNQLRQRSGIDTTVLSPDQIKPVISYAVPSFVERDSTFASVPAYGYTLFNYSPTTFQPSVNIPVPVNYVIGPGDDVVITLWGETQLVQRLTVAPDGSIFIPDAGLVHVSGLTIGALKEKLFGILSKSYSSLDISAKGGAKTHLDVSTGKLRSVKIFVLGEVSKPGGYTLPALSTAFTALYYSGGPNLNGSLRNIQVIRNGKVVSTIDLYNYLTKGDQSSDFQLEDEDILFIPPVGPRVAILGKIFRPAIYELKKGDELKNLLQYAGGVNFSVYYQSVHVERIIPFNERKDYQNNILSVDLNFKSIEQFKNSNYPLIDGDIVRIKGINDLPQNRVSVKGEVKQPGDYEFTSNMRVRDLLIKADTLTPEAFTGKGIIIRTRPNLQQAMLNFNIAKALQGDPQNNLLLENRDTVVVFKDSLFFPIKQVEIFGPVRNPGKYTSYEGMTVTDLITLAGGLTDSATTKNIEVTRLNDQNEFTYSEKYVVNLPKDYWNSDRSKDFVLKPYDKVFIQIDPYIKYTKNVYINGEVKYPGAYAILYNGEKVTDFIKRTGGFKSTAYKDGIYVYRKSDIFSEIETDTTGLPDSTKAKLLSSSFYNRSGIIKKYSQRIPILWGDIQKDSTSIYNLVLQPEDSLVVPKNLNEVYVLGAVGIPSTVPYKKGASLDYYLTQAGGYTENASKGDEIVIQPNGKKWEKSGWFFIPDQDILSGSTIIVPTKIRSYGDTWTTIRDIVTITSSAAVLLLTIKNLK